jgi:SOS-response transcriptional repressor LexA
MQALKKEDPVEMEAFYDEIHSRANPQNHSAMWVAWMLAIEEKYNNGKQAKLAKKEEEPVIVKNESGKKEPEKPATPPEIEPEKKEEPEPEPVPAEVEKNGSASPLEYSNGDPVELDDVTDYEIYLHRFTYAPENKDYMLRAKEMSGEDWKQE